MSRYHVQVGDATFAYGYDKPQDEYFLQKHTPGQDGYPQVEDLVGSYTGNGYGTAGELLEAVQRFKLPLPTDHLMAVCLEQPF
jgi:hypothetical protein